MLQDGTVYLTTDMMDRMETDDQLGMMIGHEISHTILSHGVSFTSCVTRR